MAKKETDTTEEKLNRKPVEDPPAPPEADDEIEILSIEGMDDSGTPAASPGPGTVEAGEEDGSVDLRDRMEALRREKEEAQERLLRKHADLENARKRLEREKQEFIRFAGSELIRRLLPVLDNLERALGAPGEVDDSLREGIRLVHQQFLEVLKKEGLEPVEALGRPFDPTLHEAVLREETVDRNPDEVIGVLQKGYSFRGRLLRPAMVKVAVRPAAPAEDAGEAGDAAGAGEVEEAEESEEAGRPEETI